MTGMPSHSLKIRRQDSFRFESLAVLILLCIATSLLSPYFLTGRNLLNVLLSSFDVILEFDPTTGGLKNWAW